MSCVHEITSICTWICQIGSYPNGVSTIAVLDKWQGTLVNWCSLMLHVRDKGQWKKTAVITQVSILTMIGIFIHMSPAPPVPRALLWRVDHMCSDTPQTKMYTYLQNIATWYIYRNTDLMIDQLRRKLLGVTITLLIIVDSVAKLVVNVFPIRPRHH